MVFISLICPNKNNNRRSGPALVEKAGQERFFSKDQKRRKILCLPEDVKQVTSRTGKSHNRRDAFPVRLRVTVYLG
jgi:hypothetical protein